MRRAISATLLASALILGATGAGAATKDKSPEAKLARAIEGRTAGEPVKCIRLRDIRSSQIIDKTAIVYTVGSTVYVNRPDSGASSLDTWDVMVTDTRSPDLCDIDVVRLYDTTSRMQTGFVSLGKFVPYRKEQTAKAD